MNNSKTKVEKYDKLLSNIRSKPTSLPGRTRVIEAESDRSRVVFSPPFRRLQQKAQVFSLEANAAVRSRLTHSLEVAQIGRFLGDLIVEKLLTDEIMDAHQARAFVTFVEVACLMHDLGNPPFGHFGEAAICHWFKENGESAVRKAIGSEVKNYHNDDENIKTEIQNSLADFLEFDGNCQGLRIACLLQWNDHEHGLNLTFTSLAAYLKYIRAPLYDSSEVKNLKFRKKAGFFNTEAHIVEKIWDHFGYSKSNPQRFPLAYVMEAADDIAYCISDLEDSIEKGLLSTHGVFSDLKNNWEVVSNRCPDHDKYKDQIQNLFDHAEKSTGNTSTTFTNFRTKLSTLLTEIASSTYCEDHESVLNGECDGLIPNSSAGGLALDMLKTYCKQHVYQHTTVQRKELAGLNAIRGLLDHYACLLTCNQQRFQAAMDGETKDATGQVILIERKLLSLFPERYKEAYKYSNSRLIQGSDIDLKNALSEWNLRAHLVTDFISGMTDDFALWSFQMHSGIRFE